MSLREVPWPHEAVPAGSFSKIAELTASRRVVLTAIEANEPILASKITGSGQRATLSAMLGDGMKAVTIRVNDVEGVAGFVLPGDHVDVVLTRQQDKAVAASDVVLQNVRVLAVDQIADERAEKPSVAKAVTLEVEVTAAQKLALAATIGTFSLALRKAGEATAANHAPNHGQRSAEQHHHRQSLHHRLGRSRRSEIRIFGPERGRWQPRACCGRGSMNRRQQRQPKRPNLYGDRGRQTGEND